MTMTDPIADMLTRIRNGIQVRRKSVDMPSSRAKSSIALVLKEGGYIKDVEALTDDKGFGVSCPTPWCQVSSFWGCSSGTW